MNNIIARVLRVVFVVALILAALVSIGLALAVAWPPQR